MDAGDVELDSVPEGCGIPAAATVLFEDTPLHIDAKTEMRSGNLTMHQPNDDASHVVAVVAKSWTMNGRDYWAKRKKLLHEVEIMQGLSATTPSPFILRMYGMVGRAHRVWMVLDRWSASLQSVITGGAVVGSLPPLSPLDALSILAQAAQGVCVMHALGYLHRDVASRNIMLREAQLSWNGAAAASAGIAAAVGSTCRYVACIADFGATVHVGCNETIQDEATATNCAAPTTRAYTPDNDRFALYGPTRTMAPESMLAAGETDDADDEIDGVDISDEPDHPDDVGAGSNGSIVAVGADVDGIAAAAEHASVPRSSRRVGPVHTAASDVWGIGVTIWSTLAKQRPYASVNTPSEAREHVLGGATLPLLTVETTGLAAEALIVLNTTVLVGCLARTPSSRLTAEQVSRELTRIAASC
jgi:serine/threonine protein kinase